MIKEKVYVNRTLNMKRIKYIGFDMDHTLIRYNTEKFEALAYRKMLEKLVDNLRYPKEILNLQFDFTLAIRGLVVDKDSGNLLKLSRFGAIRRSYHGLKPIKYYQRRNLYRSTYIDLGDPNYDTIDTAFSISKASLFSQLVDLKDRSSIIGLPDYRMIYNDLSQILDESHRDGSLKDVVRAHLSDYIIKDPQLVEDLERYVRHGKKVFVVTNSDFSYTKLLLDYAIDPFLKDYKSWLDLFEVVVTSAQKPRFFYDRLPFLQINPSDGTMVNFDKKIVPGVYQGGAASRFTESLDLKADEILYVGDHMYGDIVRLKKDCAWRTALVVEELQQEVEQLDATREHSLEIDGLMSKKIPLEVQVDELISNKIERGNTDQQGRIDALIAQIAGIDKEISLIIKNKQNVFNLHWGELMREGIEESYLAYQIERFACIYMAKLSDMLNMSPRMYYRSTYRAMPHDCG